MEVMVTEKGITLNSLQGGSNNPNMLANVIGSTMKLDDLIKMLRNAACDIFPEDDAFCYTETSCEKNYVMELHIYCCMSCFALSHNFSWSRWNMAAGSRTCVFLMRELQEMRKLVGWFSFGVVFKSPWLIQPFYMKCLKLIFFHPQSQTNQRFTWLRSKLVSSTVPKFHQHIAQRRFRVITMPTPIIWWSRKFRLFRRWNWTPWIQFCGRTFSSFWSPYVRSASAKSS